MRLALAACLIGCGAPVVHRAEPDFDATRTGAFELPIDDAAAIGRWRELAPTFGTWARVRREIPEPLRKPLARAVLRAGGFACAVRTRAECRLAMAAASALAMHGDPRFLPRRPLSRALADNVRVLCLAASPSEDAIAADHVTGVLAAYVAPGPRALRIAWHDKIDTYDRSHPPGELEDAIAATLGSCTGTRCDNGRDVVDLAFAPAPDGGLFLTGIQMYAGQGACHGFGSPAGAFTRGFSDEDFEGGEHPGTPLFEMFGPGSS